MNYVYREIRWSEVSIWRSMVLLSVSNLYTLDKPCKSTYNLPYMGKAKKRTSSGIPNPDREQPVGERRMGKSGRIHLGALHRTGDQVGCSGVGARYRTEVMVVTS